jgi:hypothetical protein
MTATKFYYSDRFQEIENHMREDATRTRVQFGPDGIYAAPTDPLTVETLATLLHDATAGCYPEDRCGGPASRMHLADAAELLPRLAPFLHVHP